MFYEHLFFLCFYSAYSSCIIINTRVRIHFFVVRLPKKQHQDFRIYFILKLEITNQTTARLKWKVNNAWAVRQACKCSYPLTTKIKCYLCNYLWNNSLILTVYLPYQIKQCMFGYCSGQVEGFFINVFQSNQYIIIS